MNSLILMFCCYGSISGQGQGIFLFTTAYRLALRPTVPPIHRVPKINRPGRKGDHSPPSSAEVKNA
jgi:hypothetical protein